MKRNYWKEFWYKWTDEGYVQNTRKFWATQFTIMAFVFGILKIIEILNVWLFDGSLIKPLSTEIVLGMVGFASTFIGWYSYDKKNGDSK